MKRWAVVIFTALLGSVWTFLNRSANPGLGWDSDTNEMVTQLARRNDAFSWFGGDWPLHNHFYRPVSALVFEFDRVVYGGWAPGYGITNAVLVILTIWGLAWFLRELTDRPGVTAAATALFTLWIMDAGGRLALPCLVMAALTLAGGFVRHGLKIRYYAVAALAWLWLAWQSPGVGYLSYRMLGWAPGRTASTMGVFCLIAVAAYARYERLGSGRTPRRLTATDRPATRTTIAQIAPSRWLILWPALALLATVAALLSYEQAVMLPAVLLAVAVAFRLDGRLPRWGWQIAFWAMLFAYLAVRSQLVPRDPSAYQVQQYRSGAGVWMSMATYSLPSLKGIPSATVMLESDPIIWLTTSPWMLLASFGADVSAILVVRPQWRLPATGFAMSFLAFLPMAWFSPFDHYHYWPMALQTLLVVGVAVATLQATSTAWSRPAQQAPPRPVPAPGSLPHP